MRLRVKLIFVTILLFSIWLGVCASFESSSDSVIVIELDGVINLGASELIKEGLDEAYKIDAMRAHLLSLTLSPTL